MTGSISPNHLVSRVYEITFGLITAGLRRHNALKPDLSTRLMLRTAQLSARSAFAPGLRALTLATQSFVRARQLLYGPSLPPP